MAFLGSGPFTHTDLGDQRVVDPFGLSLATSYPTAYLYYDEIHALKEVWSYTVPANTKATIQGITVHSSPSAVIGSTIFDHARNGEARRGAIITLSVGGTPIAELEGKCSGFLEQGGTNPSQYANSRDADLSTKFTFGDGIILTSGAILTASAAVADPGHTLPGIWPQSYHLRLYGTTGGQPRHIDARCFPTEVGTFSFSWQGSAQHTLAGNFTCLGMSLRTEMGGSVVSAYNVLTLNGQFLASVGHFTSASGSMAEPQHIPLWGAELYPGDKLSLRAALGPDLGQTISATMVGVETNFGAVADPSFVNVSPTSGTQLTTDSTAITFQVNNTGGLPFAIWIKFRSESRAFLVYDSLDGFKYPFTASTIDASNPLMPAFVLNQVGGWQDEIEDLRLGGVA